MDTCLPARQGISETQINNMNNNAPVVQWIEFQVPVLMMGVRFPPGAQIGLDK